MSSCVSRRRTHSLALLATAAIVAYAFSPLRSEAAATGWVTHRTHGFSLNVPFDWKVSADERSGRVDLRGPRREHIVIWPAWAPAGLDVARARMIAGYVAKRIGASVGLASGWGGAQPLSATAVRIIGRSGDRAGTLTIAWISTTRGAAVFVYAIAAPQRAYRGDQDAFTHILASFRVTGNPSARPTSRVAMADAGIRYVSWTDPREGAFSLDVPEGWVIQGGLIRRNALDPRGVLRIRSPDGTILLASGDAQLPGFFIPLPQYAAMFPTGSWYSPGAGIEWQSRPFTPAVPFGEAYLRLRIPGVCDGLRMRLERERPDVAATMDRTTAGFGRFGQVVNSAGELAFTCTQRGQPRDGYLFVTTQMELSGGLRIWYAKDLLMYLAPPSKTAEAQAIIAHMYRTLSVNPQWVARQQRTTMQVSQIATQTQTDISQTIMSGYWSRQAVMDSTSHEWENEMLGATDVEDPSTGEKFQVDDSSTYYWINAKGTIVGTQTDAAPSVDFSRLTRLP
jgi:hypothetical protein